ncbi:hypothetical protein Hokovirus_2_36 [Hokovirus HKV1]|uniref:Uncharacterized protein n=1 Tax=Hokovirus HKV1 TaxID=1977638 RepID=A0A1V0SFK9_9VIRU|nr:hypothetical protein Hokovirus_2_36 [Hokovirus HKV1]
MEFRILKLDAHINRFGELKMTSLPDRLNIFEKEQLINNVYDFIIINCDDICHITMKSILESQNYVCCMYNNMLSTFWYINKELNTNMYIRAVSRYKTYFDFFNKIYLPFNSVHDFFKDKLPCFISTEFHEAEHLEKFYKITKINVPNTYYLECKGQLTKAAVK